MPPTAQTLLPIWVVLICLSLSLCVCSKGVLQREAEGHLLVDSLFWRTLFSATATPAARCLQHSLHFEGHEGMVAREAIRGEVLAIRLHPADKVVQITLATLLHNARRAVAQHSLFAPRAWETGGVHQT